MNSGARDAAQTGHKRQATKTGRHVVENLESLRYRTPEKLEPTAVRLDTPSPPPPPPTPPGALLPPSGFRLLAG